MIKPSYLKGSYLGCLVLFIGDWLEQSGCALMLEECQVWLCYRCFKAGKVRSGVSVEASQADTHWQWGSRLSE